MNEKQSSIREAIDLIKDINNIELAKIWFQDFYNQPDILSKTNPRKFKEYVSPNNYIKRDTGDKKDYTSKRQYYIKKSTGNSNKISKFFRVCNNAGFFDVKKFKQERTLRGEVSSRYIKKYRLNIEVYFNYLRLKKGAILRKDEKKLIGAELEENYRFFPYTYRNNRSINLIEVLDEHLKIATLRHLEYLKEDIKNNLKDKKKEIFLWIGISLNMFDNFTARAFKLLIQEKLGNLMIEEESLSTEQKDFIKYLNKYTSKERLVLHL